ncbi:hypothetical protein EDD22DRAFT_783707, partial [Suillus occidentalis]
NLRILDALHLSLIVHCVYYYLVINYTNVGALTEIVWSFKVSSSFGTPSTMVLMGLLYVYRIWISMCLPLDGFLRLMRYT